MDSAKKPSIKKENTERKRGRPAGRNRVPLNKTERRARNAHYERERRQETASAFKDLALAIGVPENVGNAELLSKVLAFVKKTYNKKKERLEMIEENNRLERDIEHFERVLNDLQNETESDRSNRASKSASFSSNSSNEPCNENYDKAK